MQDHIDRARRQLERVNDADESGQIAILVAAMRNLADAIEALAATPEPAPGDDLINDYRTRRQVWGEYIDRNREARQ